MSADSVISLTSEKWIHHSLAPTLPLPISTSQPLSEYVQNLQVTSEQLFIWMSSQEIMPAYLSGCLGTSYMNKSLYRSIKISQRRNWPYLKMLLAAQDPSRRSPKRITWQHADKCNLHLYYVLWSWNKCIRCDENSQPKVGNNKHIYNSLSN